MPLTGVREYWLIDPDAEQVEILACSESGCTTVGVYSRDETVTSPLLEGLSISTNVIFGA